jgi:hypothetical protein
MPLHPTSEMNIMEEGVALEFLQKVENGYVEIAD